MSVIQVTFDPSKWTAGFGSPGTPGSNGYNAFTVVPDLDGTTFWAFEYFGGGFARVNYSDGSIVHQGCMFGAPSGSNYWYNREDGSSAWAQDDQGHYYAMPNHGGNNKTLYKFHIASGPANNLLDGYCVVDATLDLSGFVGNEGGTGVANVEGWNQVIAPAADGNRYLAISNDGGSPAGVIINTATMAVVGNYSHAAGATYWASFMDKNGDFWFVVSKGDIPHTVTLVHWHPQDGVSGSNLVVTEHEISAATLGTGTNGIQFGSYVPSNHSVFLGNSISDSGQSVNISLTTFTQNAFHADDLTFFFNGQFDAPQSALMVGAQSCGLMIPGDVTPHSTNSHFGGILHFIDPAALTLTQSLDATGAILTAGFLAGGTFHDFHSGNFVYCPFGNLAYSHVNNKAAVAYEFVGSAVYIVPFADPCVVPAPPTIFAQVVADTITSGGSAVLSWVANNSTTLTSNEFGSLPLTGSMVVDPAASSFYHFHAVGAGGTADAVVELKVLSNEASFALQKIILTLKQDRIPVRGRNGGGGQR